VLRGAALCPASATQFRLMFLQEIKFKKVIKTWNVSNKDTNSELGSSEC
jgi:hypothetical protein